MSHAEQISAIDQLETYCLHMEISPPSFQIGQVCLKRDIGEIHFYKARCEVKDLQLWVETRQLSLTPEKAKTIASQMCLDRIHGTEAAHQLGDSIQIKIRFKPKRSRQRGGSLSPDLNPYETHSDPYLSFPQKYSLLLSLKDKPQSKNAEIFLLDLDRWKGGTIAYRPNRVFTETFSHHLIQTAGLPESTVFCTKSTHISLTAECMRYLSWVSQETVLWILSDDSAYREIDNLIRDPRVRFMTSE